MEVTIKCPHCKAIYHRYERFKNHLKRSHKISLINNSPCPDKIVVKCLKDIVTEYL